MLDQTPGWAPPSRAALRRRCTEHLASTRWGELKRSTVGRSRSVLMLRVEKSSHPRSRAPRGRGRLGHLGSGETYARDDPHYGGMLQMDSTASEVDACVRARG